MSEFEQKVLVVGGGGREHALGRTIMQQNPATQLYILPGNAGTEELGINVPHRSNDLDGIIEWSVVNMPDMVIIGPEEPLVHGLRDGLENRGVNVFGPSQAGAEIEGSKAFAKDFMRRHNIPTARFEVFDDFQLARKHVETVGYDAVIKASGLASGKGVIVPCDRNAAVAALEYMMQSRAFGAAGDVVVIEERLSGPELSVMAFTDGVTVKIMPFARDHKRLLSGDKGPNTGGMGAFAPVDVDEETREIIEKIMQKTVDGMREDGAPFQGVLFAGLMLTAEEPKVLEFNCRFGDPETEAVLPLLDTNLLEIMHAVNEGRLNEIKVIWKDGYAVCVVLASEGYPDKPMIERPIHGLDGDYGRDIIIFQAGTNRVNHQIVSSGGRVLGVTGFASTLRRAADTAYEVIGQNGVHFDGMLCRTDIGRY